MRTGIRIACGAAALAACFFLVREVSRARARHLSWRRELPADEVSRLAPLTASIADLYRAPPPPGRRVILTGPTARRDTIFTERPIRLADTTLTQPEALIFLSDSAGERFVMLRRLDLHGPDWVELMPMPHDVGMHAGVRRWTPLAHLRDLWRSGWADANGPEGFVWLGIDSAVVRYRDLVGPSFGFPYRLRAGAVAGRPGGPDRPKILSGTTLLLGGGVIGFAVVALFGGPPLVRRH